MSEQQDAFVCDPAMIDDFLCEKLDATGEKVLLEHLNDCPHCRERMQNDAAENNTWDEAEAFLKDEANDSILLSSGLGVDHKSSATGSVQIDSVLSVLAPTDDPEMLGRLGGYEVSGVIGCGGMGVVLKALDKSLDRTVAIKVLAPHLASSGAARGRFAREAKAAAAVLHPNVIAIHGVSNEAALPYLVMPYIRGESLQRRLDQRGPLPLNEILRIGQQVAAGLAAAHAQGLVHRDIKPANILLEDGVERVTITDFGLARAVDDATMTRSGVIAGTPQYMSPEQARGDSIDARSDLFSLGSLLYAMCTGRPPFRSESSYGVLRRITDDVPRSIAEINPETPRWLSVLVDRLHTKEADFRIQTSAEIEQLLHQCIAHVEQPDKQPLPESLCSRTRPSQAVQLGFAILATVAIVLMGLVSVWRTPKQKSASEQTAFTAMSTPNAATDDTVGAVSHQNPESRWDDGLTESLEEIDVAIQDLDESTKTLFQREDR